jgi:hypothetical protein
MSQSPRDSKAQALIDFRPGKAVELFYRKVVTLQQRVNVDPALRVFLTPR